MANPTPEWTEAQRRAFEASERRNYPKTGPLRREPDFGRTKADGTYYIVERENRFQGWLACASQPVTEEMVMAGARAILLDRMSPFLIREYRDNNSVGWIRACKEAKACITAALEVRNG